MAEAIPTYAIRIFKLAKSLCDELQSVIFKFWTVSNDRKRRIHWVNKERLYIPKGLGDMGFHDLRTLNLALLAKQVCRLLHNPSSLVAHLLQAKYYPNGTVLTTNLGHRPSFTWRSLWEARSITKKGTRWIIRNGCSVDI